MKLKLIFDILNDALKETVNIYESENIWVNETDKHWLRFKHNTRDDRGDWMEHGNLLVEGIAEPDFNPHLLTYFQVREVHNKPLTNKDVWMLSDAGWHNPSDYGYNRPESNYYLIQKERPIYHKLQDTIASMLPITFILSDDQSRLSLKDHPRYEGKYIARKGNCTTCSFKIGDTCGVHWRSLPCHPLAREDSVGIKWERLA